MAKNKTAATKKSVKAFIGEIEDEGKRDDSHALMEMMEGLTGFKPVLWGPSIIGFGSVHYKYESGQEGDMPMAAFSPRKNALVLYLLGFPKRDEFLLKLGKFKASKGCIYIKKLEDIDMIVLEKMVAASLKNKSK